MFRILYWAFCAVLAGIAALYIYQGIALIPARLPVDYQDAFYLGGFFLAAALLMIGRLEALKIAGTWLGIFLIVQMFAPSSLGLVNQHIQRAPNLVLYVEAHNFPGVTGLQMITTDRQGFRSDPPVDYTRKSRLRIVALGGSTTEEFVLDDRATWTHRLQEELKAQHVDVEVINAGMSGTRTVHHVASLRYVLRFEPDIAIFLIGHNDWSEGIRRSMYPFMTGERLRASNTLLVRAIRRIGHLYLPRGASAKNFPRLPDGSVPDVPPQYRTVISIRTAEGPRVWSRPRPPVVPTVVDEGFRRELVELAETCRVAKIRCLVMTQPSAYQQNADPGYVEALQRRAAVPDPIADFVIYVQRYSDYLRTFASQNGLALCDLTSQVRPSFEVFYDSHHYNITGARRIGALVKDCVMKMLADAGRTSGPPQGAPR
jgi:lysophospholipase L1-like esterase